MLTKSARWDWTDNCRLAFENLKTALVNAAMSYHVQPEGTLMLSTDCSKYALDAVLEQMIEKELFPVAYYSRSLKPAEVNYMNYEREGLALVASIKHLTISSSKRFYRVY
jgi:tRNA G46 methylase TrmB